MVLRRTLVATEVFCTTFAFVLGQRTTLGRWRIKRDSISLAFPAVERSLSSSKYLTLACSAELLFFPQCGQGNGTEDDYDAGCTTLENLSSSQMYNPNQVLYDIDRYYENGLIETPRKLLNTFLYVFTGLSNWFITPEMFLNILKIYGPLIRNPSRIFTLVMDADNLLPSDTYGQDCTERETENDYLIGNCGLSGAWESLWFLLGPYIKKPGNLRLHTSSKSTIGATADVQPKGILRPGEDFVGPGHILNSGFLEVTEVNNIIMVFPQNVNAPGNDIGCWDTYGFTGKY